MKIKELTKKWDKFLSEQEEEWVTIKNTPTHRPAPTPKSVDKTKLSNLGSAVVGNLHGHPIKKGTPYGLLINGVELKPNDRMILGKNMHGNQKSNKWGTVELLQVIKAGIDQVHKKEQEDPEFYHRLNFMDIMGQDYPYQGASTTDRDPKNIEVLRFLGVIQDKTGPLYIEDLAEAPFHTGKDGTTWHSGKNLPNHGSHQTGQDADLGLYMRPGAEMKASFPRKVTTRVFRYRGNNRAVHQSRFAIFKHDTLAQLYRSYTVLQQGSSAMRSLGMEVDPAIEDAHRQNEYTRLKKKIRGKKQLMGTMDPDRTWQLLLGMVNTGLVQGIVLDRSLWPDLEAAAIRAGEKSQWRSVRSKLWHDKKGNHKNHIHVRVYAKSSVARGKVMTKELKKDFKKYKNTRAWAKANAIPARAFVTMVAGMPWFQWYHGTGKYAPKPAGPLPSISTGGEHGPKITQQRSPQRKKKIRIKSK